MVHRPQHVPVFHGRTRVVAYVIVTALGSGITHYNQVTNLAQLRGITSLDFVDYDDYDEFSSKQAIFKASPTCKR